MPKYKIDRSVVAQTALNAGFMLSTQYGQGANKRMPVSDVQTLVDFATAILKEVAFEDLDVSEAPKPRKKPFQL